MCERRSGGVKSTLKPVQNGATAFRMPHSLTRSLVLEDTLVNSGPSRRVTDGRPPCTATAQQPDRVAEQWESYTNGGAREDDQRYSLERKEHQERYYAQIRSCTPGAGTCSVGDKLIQVSPEKTATVSRNTDLLLDLDVELSSSQGRHDVGRSFAKAASSGAVKSTYTNLLD